MIIQPPENCSTSKLVAQRESPSRRVQHVVLESSPWIGCPLPSGRAFVVLFYARKLFARVYENFRHKEERTAAAAVVRCTHYYSIRTQLCCWCWWKCEWTRATHAPWRLRQIVHHTAGWQERRHTRDFTIRGVVVVRKRVTVVVVGVVDVVPSPTNWRKWSGQWWVGREDFSENEIMNIDSLVENYWKMYA